MIGRLANCFLIARTLAAVVAVLVSVAPFSASAVEPDEILRDPVLEHRARVISVDLRCLVCQNQSIDDSNAPLARDLRLLVRERLRAGDTDADVFQFIVARYGEFVLLRPPLTWHTSVLWATPLILLMGAIFGLFLYRRRMLGHPDAVAALSPEEQARLEALLADKPPSGP
jgi:cytochrome c-type biogenesis protein CcmH